MNIRLIIGNYLRQKTRERDHLKNINSQSLIFYPEKHLLYRRQIKFRELTARKYVYYEER